MAKTKSPYLTNKQLSGLKSHKKKLQRREILLNNGEPLGTALVKIFSQLIFVLVIVALIIFGFALKTYIFNKLSDDNIFTLTMSSKYNTTVGNYAIEPIALEENSGACAANVIAQNFDWTSVPVTARTELISGMTSALEDNFGADNVDVKTNISNYTMLTEIYSNLENGNGVIVALAVPEKDKAAESKAEENAEESSSSEENKEEKKSKKNKDSEEDTEEAEKSTPKEAIAEKTAEKMCYAVVIAANYSSDEITIALPNGSTRTLTATEFVSSTRFELLKKTTIKEKLEFIFGLRSVNTVYFIENPNNNISDEEE